MASADFLQPIPAPLDAGSTRQAGGPPRVMRTTFMLMPVGSTSQRSVQVLGFDDLGLLTPLRRLISASCSSGQHFACGFLQIPPRDGHPCRSANTSPCRVCRGLSPPSHLSPPPQRLQQRQSRRYAPCLAHQKNPISPGRNGAIQNRPWTYSLKGPKAIYGWIKSQIKPKTMGLSIFLCFPNLLNSCNEDSCPLNRASSQ